MKNSIVSFASLSQDVKAAFMSWLVHTGPELISFPYKGKHMQGYVFNHNEENYLVVMRQYDYEPFNWDYTDYDDYSELEISA